MDLLKALLNNKRRNQQYQGAVINPEWSHPFESWAAAVVATDGYDQPQFFTKLRNAAQQVRDGKAVYERDSVLFDEAAYAWPVLAILQKIALEHDGCITVVDFGGALGTSYYQCRKFLQSIRELNWCVVEQPHIVDCGQREFASAELHFYTTIEQALEKRNAHCLLASGVIQVLEKPYEWIDKYSRYGFSNLLFDRVSFINDRTTLVAQQVPEYIHNMSYPHWFFNEQEWLAAFKDTQQLQHTFDSAFDPGATFHKGQSLYWKGFHFMPLSAQL